VAVDATTTLQGLAAKINALDAGVSASVVNAGLRPPDFRLRVATTETGASHDLTIVTDNTTLGMRVTQAAANASFTVTGFAAPLVREQNSFEDVIPGVRIALTRGRRSPSRSATDVAAVTDNVNTLVAAFNDLVSFVAGESEVTQNTSSSDRSVTAGPLAFDSTVRSVLSGIHGVMSSAVSGLEGGGGLTLLAQIGITTKRDGTLAFDAAKLSSALTEDTGAVGALVGGTTAVGGVADPPARLPDRLTRSGGLVDVRDRSVADQLTAVEDQIAAGERRLGEFEANLRATFTNLEVLVNGLQSQGAFLLSALGVGGRST